jgi:hypothetical protein
MIAYKLFSLRKDGSIGSLFINRKRKLPTNEWLIAESFPTKGYKFRPYWHCTSKPIAPHLTEKNRIWLKVEIENYSEFKRPNTQGGLWFLANKMKILNK